MSIGWYENNWYKIIPSGENLNCTVDQMVEAAQGHLTTEAVMWNEKTQKTISGMVRLKGSLL